MDDIGPYGAQKACEKKARKARYEASPIKVRPQQDLSRYVEENVDNLVQEYIKQLWLDYSNKGHHQDAWKTFYDSDGNYAANMLWEAGHLVRKEFGESCGYMMLDDYNEVKETE